VKKSKSSNRWLKEHFSDVYVKRAKQDGYRARSVYKLVETQERYKFIKPNMLIVDLGAVPGGWSEYAVRLVASEGMVFALDILPLQPIKGVDFIQGDFTRDEVVQELYTRLNGKKVDVVMSDMAPNLSGVSTVDQARSVNLATLAAAFAQKVLKPGGVFLTKIFQGEGFETYLKNLRHSYGEVKVIKPDASRSRSREVFLLARGFKGVI
jgi:23S rRNA (uridine2552-2'-O)-methyltransferase